MLHNLISDPALKAKMNRLIQFLQGFSRVAIAYSGGVDSAFMAKLAHDVLGKDRVLCVIANSETLSENEFKQATQLANDNNWNLQILTYSELEIENYASNPTDRCYFCKYELFTRIKDALNGKDIEAIFDGTNVDDVGDYRPGMKAIKEHQVISPLKECGLTKDDIRKLSLHLGLPTHDKPSAPCLSSRFPYGIKITPERLKMVAQAEEFLRDLGFRELRVRYHETIARIEIPPEEFSRLFQKDNRERIIQQFKKIGFLYVTLDIRGFRSGSLNDILFEKTKEG